MWIIGFVQSFGGKGAENGGWGLAGKGRGVGVGGFEVLVEWHPGLSMGVGDGISGCAGRGGGVGSCF